MGSRLKLWLLEQWYGRGLCPHCKGWGIEVLSPPPHTPCALCRTTGKRPRGFRGWLEIRRMHHYDNKHVKRYHWYEFWLSLLGYDQLYDDGTPEEDNETDA